MWSLRNSVAGSSAAAQGLPTIAAVFTVLMMLAPVVSAQTDNARPEALAKQRSDLYLRAMQAPLANLESDVNHLAVLSETCRIKYGSAACGLPDKALESDKLEERYAYYVKQPVEAHAKVHPVKVDRRNWAGPAAPAQP